MRRKWFITVALVFALVAMPLVALLGLAVLAGGTPPDQCTPVSGNVAAAASATSATPAANAAVASIPPGKEIPSYLMPIYTAAEKKYGTPRFLLAAVNSVETSFGQNMNTSSAGAIGWMQFLPSTWRIYGVDGNHDGVKDPYNPYDAIYGAARYLAASGAPGNIKKALWAYNHSDVYYRDVTQLALAYGLNPDDLANDATCLPQAVNVGTLLHGTGTIIVAPGANRPGFPVRPETMAFFRVVAAIYGKPMVLTTGTNHSYLTVYGNVSDHATGQAGDFGMYANGGYNDSPVGDAIATACLTAAGDPPALARAEAQRGGAYNRVHAGYRIECIWKTFIGGDHHNHVHISAVKQ